MKKLVAIFLLITGFAHAQIMVTPDGHPRFPKKGVADTIVATDTILISKVKGEVFGIAYPDFIDGIGGVSSFADLTGAPEDNTALAASLLLKAYDDEVVKTDPASPTQNLDAWMGNKEQFKTDNPTNDIIFITDSIPADQIQENKIFVDGSGGVSYKNALIIPESATYIKNKTFKSLGVSSVDLSTSLDSIQDYAFQDNNIVSITLPNDIQKIGGAAFDGNKATGTLTLPNSLTSMGFAAFQNNDFSAVEIGTGLNKLNNNVFANNEFTSISIPSNITAIGNQAFGGNKITSLTLPANVASLGNYSFSSNQISSITWSSGALDSIPSFCFLNNKLTTLTLPTGIEVVGNSSFKTNLLTSVTFPTTIKKIEYGAFLENPSLASVSVPSSARLASGTSCFDLGIDLTMYVNGTNLYNVANVVSVGSEANSLTGLSITNPSNATLSISTDADDGTYAAKVECTTVGEQQLQFTITGLDTENKRYTVFARIKTGGIYLNDPSLYVTSLPNISTASFYENRGVSRGYYGNIFVSNNETDEGGTYTGNISFTFTEVGQTFLVDKLIVTEVNE